MSELKVLQTIAAEEFEKKCLEQMQDKSIRETAKGRINTLYAFSYGINALSILTGSFFVFFIVSGLPMRYKYIMGLILIAILCANEYLKREQLTKAFKAFFKGGKLQFFTLIFLIVAIGVSMTSSSIGGNWLVTKTATPPQLAANPEINSLQEQLEVVQKSIIDQESTTWQGVITVDANRNLKVLYPQKALLLEQINQLKNEDKLAQVKSNQEFVKNNYNLGLVAAGIALLLDIVLVLIFRTVWQIKSQVASLAKLKTPTPTPASKTITPSVPAVDVPGAALSALSADKSFNEGELIQLLISGARGYKSGFSKRKSEASQTKAQELDNLIKTLEPYTQPVKAQA